MADEEFSGSVGIGGHLRVGQRNSGVILESNPGGTGLLAGGVQVTGPGSASYANTGVYIAAPTAFRNYNAAVARARDGGLAAKIICKGDSTTLGVFGYNPSGILSYRSTSWVEACRKILNSAQYLGGANLVREGVVSLYNDGVGGETANRYVMGTGWANVNGRAEATTATVGNLTYTDDGVSGLNTDCFDIFVARNSGNTTFTYTLNGGGAQTVDLTALGAIGGVYRTRTITTTRQTTNVLAIQKPAAGNLDVFGVQGIDSTIPHLVDMTRTGTSGQTLATFVSNKSISGGNAWGPSITALVPDLVILWLGINDGLGSNAPATIATYGANLADAVSTLQAASCDVVLVTFPDFGYFAGSTLATAATEAQPWHAQVYSVANTYGCAVFDLARRWGYDAKALQVDAIGGNNLAATGGVYALYNGVHPTGVKGYRDIAQMFSQALMPA